MLNGPTDTTGLAGRVGLLVQRVVAHQVLGVRDRRAWLVLAFQELCQAFQRLAKSLAQALAFGHDPVVVATGQQLTP
jgi:hypothetical protein